MPVFYTVLFDVMSSMNSSPTSPDVLEETTLPVPQLPGLPSINQSPGLNSVNSTSEAGVDVSHNDDAYDNGLSEVLLEDSDVNFMATIHQETFVDSMQNEAETTSNPSTLCGSLTQTLVIKKMMRRKGGVSYIQ